MGTDNSVNTMQDELFEHRGETTTAQVLEKVNISNRYYIKIKINKGNFQDKMGLMVYNKNFETIEDAKIFLIVKIENCEIIIHNYGDLTFKDCKDKEKIEKIAKEIYNERFIIA